MVPPAVASSASLQLVQSENWRREKLNQLIAEFRLGAADIGLNLMDSKTAIQPILVEDNHRAWL